MTSPTASITFQCHPTGLIVPDLLADPNANDQGTRNAIAIERLVHFIVDAPDSVRNAVEAAMEALATDAIGKGPDPMPIEMLTEDLPEDNTP